VKITRNPPYTLVATETLSKVEVFSVAHPEGTSPRPAYN
jgi:hypothetical protein